MNLEEIYSSLNELPLNKSEYCILGSASLVIRGIKEKANDIDILITTKEYNKIKTSKYSKIDFIVKDEIDITVEWYDDYQLQTLEEMLENKKKRNLDKDKIDIELIEKKIEERNSSGEYTDLYDLNKVKLDEIMFRKKGTKLLVPKDRYTIVVIGLIKNSDSKYLIQRASKRKKSVFCLPGGHVRHDEDSLAAIKNELKEEMNLIFGDSEIKLIKTYQYKDGYRDIFLINKDIDIKKTIIEKDEVEEVMFLSPSEIEKKISNGEFREHDLDVFYDIIKVQ